ncbi:LysR substrate-binding domain-containing protein [Paracoccus tibetensis]|uniref:LysR substrate binding domain-containing protein n=1 Tax=Paracoccus tibetensis TaxID=336292 RepID=A0A1G5JYJ1_9RHOB|nr:LysR substrate binding domain-containing protein [Paracoccus tibetensis]
MVASVARGEADLGFTAGTVGTRDQLSFQALLDDPFVAVGPTGGLLAENRPYALSDLIRMPFIAMAPGTSVRELLDGACARIGRQLEPHFEVSHLATAGALVAQGLGVSALPRLTLPVLGSRDLLIRPIADFGASRRIGLVWRSGRTLSPPARAFLKLVRSAPLQTVAWS